MKELFDKIAMNKNFLLFMVLFSLFGLTMDITSEIYAPTAMAALYDAVNACIMLWCLCRFTRFYQAVRKVNTGN